MRILITLLLFVFSLCFNAFAGFDDFLKDVLVETQNQAIGTNEYFFAPGDAVIKKDTFIVYYSGSEISDGTRILLLTLVDSQGSILIKYPSPDTIAVKSFRLKILSFNNSGLQIRVLEKG